jgi:hypothetical protein
MVELDNRDKGLHEIPQKIDLKFNITPEFATV